MLSNTAETKPKPSAVGHEAAGSFSTGINEAAVTNARRKIVPLKVSGITFQSGARSPAVSRMTAQTAMPRTGTESSRTGNFKLAGIFGASSSTRVATSMDAHAQSLY